MKDAVEEIKERLSILDVVAGYVELQKSGRQYKGKSPFTNERTPSFFVSPDRGMYYCFSSHQGGDMFTFVQAMEGVDFKGALKILAEKAHVSLAHESSTERSKRDHLYALLDTAAEFFTNALHTDHTAQQYVQTRGVRAGTIATWRIGYAPGPPHHGWRELREHLRAAGYTDEQMLQVGVVKPGSDGKPPYDLFRDRIVFPITDASGRVIGFSGRSLHENERAPKYVNSPDTPLFHKSAALFGLSHAKQGIRSLDCALVVEGQFDVVLAHQAGYRNAVAVSGTALTDTHVAALQRYSNRVVLALDADAGGVRAVQRAAAIMFARGMEVKVAQLPTGSDPADLILREGEEFKECVRSAVTAVEFLLAVIRERAADQRGFMLHARDEVLPLIAAMTSEVEREYFLKVVADALRLPVDAVRNDYLSFNRQKEKDIPQEVETPSAARTTAPSPQGVPRHERLLQYCVALCDVVDSVESDTIGKVVLSVTGSAPAVWREHYGAQVLNPLTFEAETHMGELTAHTRRQEVAGLLEELSRLYYQHQIRTLNAQLREAELAGAHERAGELLSEINDAQAKLRDVHVTIPNPPAVK